MTTEVKEIREGYKMTELGEIPVEWEVITTGELFENVSKKGFEELPVLSVTQEKGVVYRDELDINIKYDKKSLKNYKLIEPGQFVISLRSFQGGIEYASIKGISSPAYTVLKPSELVYPEYFKYLFKSFWFIDKLKGTIIGIRDGKQISYSDFKIIQLLLPPIKEQQKIAEILTTVDEQIESIAQLIEKTMELKNGLLQQLLTTGIGHTQFKKTALGEIPVAWEVTNFFEHIINILDFRGKTPKKIGMDWGNGDIPALSANNVKMGYIDFSAECYLGSEELYKKWMTKGDLRQGDVLFTMEAPLGNVAQVPDNNKYILSQRVVAFKTDDQLNDCYLKYFLMSPHFQMGLEKNSTGTTAKGISQKNLSKLKMIIPPLDEQQKIAEILSAVDDQIQSYQQEKAKYEELKRGLIQQLLTGKIRVTV